MRSHPLLPISRPEKFPREKSLDTAIIPSYKSLPDYDDSQLTDFPIRERALSIFNLDEQDFSTEPGPT